MSEKQGNNVHHFAFTFFLQQNRQSFQIYAKKQLKYNQIIKLKGTVSWKPQRIIILVTLSYLVGDISSFEIYTGRYQQFCIIYLIDLLLLSSFTAFSCYLYLLKSSIQNFKCASDTIWVKVFKNGPSKVCGRQPLKNLRISLQIFKGCLAQLLLGPFLNTLNHMMNV